MVRTGRPEHQPAAWVLDLMAPTEARVRPTAMNLDRNIDLMERA